jgi:hypothetical protein
MVGRRLFAGKYLFHATGHFQAYRPGDRMVPTITVFAATAD